MHISAVLIRGFCILGLVSGLAGCAESGEVVIPPESTAVPLTPPELLPLPDFMESVDVDALVARLQAAVNATTACGTDHMQIPDWQWEMAPLMPPGRIGFNQCVDAAIARQAQYSARTQEQRDNEYARLHHEANELEQRAAALLAAPSTFGSVVEAEVFGSSVSAMADIANYLQLERAEREEIEAKGASGYDVSNLSGRVTNLHWLLQFHEALGSKGSQCSFDSSIVDDYDATVAELETLQTHAELPGYESQIGHALRSAHWLREHGNEEGMRYLLAFLERTVAYANVTMPEGEITTEYMVALLHNRHAEERTLQRGHMVIGDMTYFMTGEFGDGFVPDRYRKAIALDEVGWHFEELLECT